MFCTHYSSNTNTATAYYSTATFCKTNCRSTQGALVAETTLIAESDGLQSRKGGQSVQFLLLIKKKKYRGTTAVLLI